MINHPSRLPRASSNWFPSFVSSSQASCLQSTEVVSHVVHADDGDADDEVGGIFTVMTIMVLVLVLVLPYLIQQ